MSNIDDRSEQAAAMRRIAEEKSLANEALLPGNTASLSPEQIARTVHELQVHQIELEMQNDELRRTQSELDASRARYIDLYDLAPVGYCTVNDQGIILEANLTAVKLLATTREQLIKRPLSKFIHPEDQDIYYLHRKQLFSSGDPQLCELRMLTYDRKSFWVRLEATTTQDTGGSAVCRVVISDITQRKLEEEAMRQSVTRYHDIFDAAVDAMIIHDPVTWQILDVNNAMLRMYGFSSKEEARNCKTGELSANAHPYTLDEAQPYLQRAMEGQTPVYEWLSKKNTGELFYTENTMRRTQIAGQTRILVVIRDITEHKQAEIYREMSIDVLKILNDSAPFPKTIQRVLGSIKSHTGFDAVGIRLQDGDDYPYFVQDGFSSDFLLTENSLIERGADGGVCRDCDGNISLECTCGLVISGRTDPAHPLMTRGGSFWVNDSFPLLELTPDQEPRNRPRNNCIHQNYASVALVPIKIQETIVGLIQLNDKRKGRFTLETVEMMEGIAAHIGSAMMRIQAEAKLKQSDDWHRTILQTAMDGFLLANMQGQVLDVNEAYCRMIGYSAQELLSMRISDLEAIDSVGEIDARHDELIKLGEMRFESQHRRKDGTICDLEISIKYDPTGDGQIVVFYHDITARKKAEEVRVALETQLQQAQKMETVGRLAGGVAHDFNNMLGVIIGHTQMAMDGLDPTLPLYEDLTEIKLAAERSAELTRQLLAFARKQTVQPKELDLNETIAGMLKMLERMVGENVQLMWKPSADIWRVKMDPSQVNQILANLCVNARDSIADVGQVQIETNNITIDESYCAIHTGFEPGDFVRLTVNDSGCGMSKDILTHVFEPFFTTKGVGEGTGLGLASVYGAVKQNDGFINVYSELGHGTLFSVYIPRFKHITKELLEGITTVPTICGHETILLVEDETSILRLAKKMLERLGYNVIAAASPGEATELAKRHHGEINLLLTDVVMPEMNGRDLARNLLSYYPGMGRLFMSGYTSDVIAHQGKVEEGMYFIQKPFSMSELSTMVRRALGD